MKDQVVLRDKDVYAKVVQIDDKVIPDRNGVPYMRFSYDQVPFIMREAAAVAWLNNEMAELVLTRNEREINGTVVEALTYGGHLTVAQDVALEKNIAAREAAHAEALAQHSELPGDEHPVATGYELTRNQKKQTPYPPKPDPEAPNQPKAGTPRPIATTQQQVDNGSTNQTEGSTGVNDSDGNNPNVPGSGQEPRK